MYLGGYGVDRNIQKHLEYLQKAADGGDTDSLIKLAADNIVFGGTNLKNPIYVLQKLANEGNDNAQNRLGVIYNAGVGIEKDVDKAVRLLVMSAKQGNTTARGNLKTICESETLACKALQNLPK